MPTASPARPRATPADLRRGATSKLAAEIVGRLVSFAGTYLAQRWLGPQLFGHLAYAQAGGHVLAQCTDLGVQLSTTRLMVLEPARAGRIAGAALLARAMLLGPVLAAVAALALARPAGVRSASFAIGAALTLTAVVELIGYCLRGRARVVDDAVLQLGVRVVSTVAGAWALVAGLGLSGLAFGWLAAAGVGVLVGWWWLRGVLGGWPSATWQESARLLARSSSLGGAILLSIAYVRTPVLVLDWAVGPVAVGLFSTAQKLTEPLSLIPAAMLAALFPALVERLGSREAGGRRLVLGASITLGAVGLVPAVAGVVFAPWLLGSLYGDDYAGAAPALRILSAAVVPVFVNVLLTHALVASGRAATLLRINIVVFVANVALNLLLARRVGPAGCAAAILACEWGLAAACSAALAGHWHRTGRVPPNEGRA